MNKIATKVHILMLLLLSIFANNFLKLSIGVSNFPLLMYFIFCIFHIIISSRNNNTKLNDIEKKVCRYLLWMGLVIILSLLGVYKLFLSDILAFDKSFIIKQSIFLTLIPIALSMYICFINDREHIESLLNKYSLFCFLFMNLLSFFGYCTSTISYYILLLLAYYSIKKNDRLFIKVLILFFSILYSRKIFNESTAFLMLIVFIIMTFNSKITNFFQNKRRLLYIVGIIVIISIFMYSNSISDFLKNYDINYWWRFSYWTNEMNVLKKVLFMGTGYGSTYASPDIFNTLIGGFIDPETGYSVNTIKALFTTAQHNSYMNILYRTGIIGFWYFINYTCSLIFKSKLYVKNLFDNMVYLAFLNSNIIILFNVGLESPQFIIPYYMALTSLMSLKRINNEV